MKFGQNMKMIRESRHMTLEEMAEFLGTTKQALSRYERGERTPKITAAARFADLLGVKLVDLVGAEDLPEEPEEYRAETKEAQILARGMDKMTEDQRKRLLDLVNIAFNYQFIDPEELEEKRKKWPKIGE